QLTFIDFLRHRIGSEFNIESPFKQMEFVLSENESDDYALRIANIHFKSSLSYKNMIDAYVNRLAKEGIQFRNITLRKRILISKEDIAGYFYSMDKHMPIPNRMEYTLKWLLKEIEKHQNIEKHKDWVMNQVELLDREDYLQDRKSTR